MKGIITRALCIIVLISVDIQSQNYNKDAFLKNYSGELIITTQVRGERNKAILRGTDHQPCR